MWNEVPEKTLCLKWFYIYSQLSPFLHFRDSQVSCQIRSLDWQRPVMLPGCLQPWSSDSAGSASSWRQKGLSEVFCFSKVKSIEQEVFISSFLFFNPLSSSIITNVSVTEEDSECHFISVHFKWNSHLTLMAHLKVWK